MSAHDSPRMPVYFDLDGVHVRTARDWADAGITPRQHAATHGFAGSWKANGAYITCTREADGRITRRSFKDGRPRHIGGKYAPDAWRTAS